MRGKAKRQKHMTDNEKSVLQNVNKILALQKGTKKWGQEEQVILISLTAIDCGLDPEAKKDFRELLAVRGMGGNASQFRQWLASKDVALIPKQATTESEYGSL